MVARIRTKCKGEGPKSFHDLRSMPKAGRPREQVENSRRACTRVLFLRKAELGFFYFLEIVTGWLAGGYLPLVRRSQYNLAGTFQRQKIPLAANRFLPAVKGAENTMEKSRQCFTFDNLT